MKSKEVLMRSIAFAHNEENEFVQERVEASILIEALIDIRDQLEQTNRVILNWANVDANKRR